MGTGVFFSSMGRSKQFLQSGPLHRLRKAALKKKNEMDKGQAGASFDLDQNQVTSPPVGGEPGGFRDLNGSLVVEGWGTIPQSPNYRASHHKSEGS